MRGSYSKTLNAEYKAKLNGEKTKMKIFYAFARTQSGKDIGKVKIDLDTELPLSVGDILTLEEECDELGN